MAPAFSNSKYTADYWRWLCGNRLCVTNDRHCVSLVFAVGHIAKPSDTAVMNERTIPIAERRSLHYKRNAALALFTYVVTSAESFVLR